MKAKEATFQVLKEAGEPLHFKEITRRITAKVPGKRKARHPNKRYMLVSAAV